MPDAKRRVVILPILISAIVLVLWVGSYLTLRTVWVMPQYSVAGQTGTTQYRARGATIRMVMLPLAGDGGRAAARIANFLYYPLCALDRLFTQRQTAFSYRWHDH